MAWQTPKTNWTSADGVSDADMNRIEGNIALLRQAANIQIADAGNVIAATNVENALQELYGNTVTGKGKIASALAVMNQTASSSDTYDTLANKIKAISTDANAAVGNVLSGKTFYQGGAKRTGTMPNRGAYNITPGTSNIAIPAGYHNGSGYVVGDPDLVTDNIKAGANIFGVAGKTSVVDTVDATAVAGDILSGKIAYVNGSKLTGSMVNRGAYNITPGASNVTIPAGYHNGSGYVVGDPDLVTDNIKAGANIFGVAGKTSVVDTVDATAVAGDILSGKTAYVNGSKLTGTMPNRGAIIITPGTTNQTIPAGYHNGAGYVVGDPDLIADNIRNGVNIFGVVGNCKRYFQAAGNITLSKAASQSISVTSCTFQPTFVLLICDDYSTRKYIAFKGTIGSWTADSMWETWRQTVTGSYSGFGSANITFTSNGFTAVSPNETLYYSTENLAWLAVRTE